MTAITLIIIVFILGYLAIALEHPIMVNKAATALLIGVLCWSIYVLSSAHPEPVIEQFTHHMPDIFGILFFLIGAMTIVEIIDAHDGFHTITSRITAKDKRTLLWMVSFITFFLSAVLDNLTTSIVMVSLLRKLLESGRDRRFFAGIVIIAANAGGAWSPVGDLTTTMLWIGGQVTPLHIMTAIFIPSVVCLLVPLLYLSLSVKGHFQRPFVSEKMRTTTFERAVVLLLGVGSLVFVPVFKTMTHLPPFMGVLFGLGVLWFVTELMHKRKTEEEKGRFSAIHALTRIDVPSVLFFFGILSAVACLESVGLLGELAILLDSTIGNLDLIAITIGVLSAIIDNVPLVAATMGMYSLEIYPTDHHLWEFIAYCAGTGGSLLIIGSAAGVAVMGIEKIDFVWYVKKISAVAFLGYVAGALTYIGLEALLN